LGQWAVTTLPSDNFTSALKRWYRFKRVPGMSSGQASSFDGISELGLFMETRPANTQEQFIKSIIPFCIAQAS
jgi:hypothetical protein